MSFLIDAVHAAGDSLDDLKAFLRSRCRTLEADIDVAIGDGVKAIAAQFVEGTPTSSDQDIWRLLSEATATVVGINCDRGEVVIAVEFEL